MELAKKPIWFLCTKSSETFRISVPKTEHHYMFYRRQPYLVKFDLDIEFFDEHESFERYVKPEVEEDESAEDLVDSVGENTPEENIENSPATEEERQPYSKKELQRMRKSDVRDILKELAPKKSSPTKKENIIQAVLDAQEPSE